LRIFQPSHTNRRLRDKEFLNLLHIEMVSSAVLTLVNPHKRWTGELFSSASRTVLRQSSMASLMAVTVRMKMRGAALRLGLAAPNMLKAYDG
jgi:hypothetical protein